MIETTTWPRADQPWNGRRYRLCEDDLFHQCARPYPAKSKATLPAFCLATFQRNYRALEKLIALFGIGVDIDGGGVSLEQVIATWGAYYGCLYSTASSRPDNTRWRVLLLLKQPITDKTDARRIIRWAARRTPGSIDQGARDPSRLWFYPWAGAAHFAHARLVGEPIDGAAVANQEREREEGERAAAELERAERLARLGRPSLARVADYGERALTRACAEVAGATEGDRHRTLTREAFSIGTLVATGALSHSRALDALDLASRAVFPAHREDERVRTLQQQLALGERNPRT